MAGNPGNELRERMRGTAEQSAGRRPGSPESLRLWGMAVETYLDAWESKIVKDWREQRHINAMMNLQIHKLQISQRPVQEQMGPTGPAPQGRVARQQAATTRSRRHRQR